MTMPDTPTVAVLGPDVVVAAAPATQAQLVAACARLGFDAVVPGSWGDELIAETTLRHLGPRCAETVVLCACPQDLVAINASRPGPLAIEVISADGEPANAPSRASPAT